jgi:hypothetical protein
MFAARCVFLFKKIIKQHCREGACPLSQMDLATGFVGGYVHVNPYPARLKFFHGSAFA